MGGPPGAINRVPAQGEVRANMHVGGKPLKTDITPAEMEICEAIGPALQERGLIFVGIDVIGGKYLTEINVTSPTGIQETNRFNGVKLEAEIWDAIETRYHATLGTRDLALESSIRLFGAHFCPQTGPRALVGPEFGAYITLGHSG